MSGELWAEMSAKEEAKVKSLKQKYKQKMTEAKVGAPTDIDTPSMRQWPSLFIKDHHWVFGQTLLDKIPLEYIPWTKSPCTNDD